MKSEISTNDSELKNENEELNSNEQESNNKEDELKNLNTPKEIIQNLVNSSPFISQLDIIKQLELKGFYYTQSNVSKLIRKSGFIRDKDRGYIPVKKDLKDTISDFISYVSPTVVTKTKAKELNVYIEKPLENALADLMNYQHTEKIKGIITGRRVVKFMFSNVEDMNFIKEILEKKEK